MSAIIGSTVAITNTHMLILVFINLNKLCIHFLSSSAVLFYKHTNYTAVTPRHSHTLQNRCQHDCAPA